MYLSSKEYGFKVKDNSRSWKYTGVISTKDGKDYHFSDKDILIGSGYINNECADSNEINLGTTYAGELGVSLLLDIDRYSLKGAEISISSHLELSEGVYEEVPLGVFNIAEANRSNKVLEITAYDNMLKFDRNFRASTTGGTAFEMVSLACDLCKVEMAQGEDWFNEQPNGSELLGIYADAELDTWRELIGYVAQVLGCFATIDRQGRLEFRKYNQKVVREFSVKDRFTSSFSDFITRYTAINSTNLRTQIAEYRSLEFDDGLTMNLGVNPLLQFGLDETRDALLNNILQDITLINYLPFDADIPIDPRLDLGDVILFRDGDADEGQVSCITSYSLEFNRSMSIKCVGKNPLLAQAKSKHDKNISGLLNQVEMGKVATHTYINPSPIDLGLEKVPVASLEFASRDNTNAQFHASILLDVKANPSEKTIQAKRLVTDIDENGQEIKREEVFDINYTGEEKVVLKVTYVFNDSEVKTYYPRETYQTGQHILTLFYPISGLKGGSYNTFRVLISVEGGKAHIERANLLASISGQGLSASSEWDGRIELNETIPKLEMPGKLSALKYKESFDISRDRSTRRGIQENVKAVLMPGGLSVEAFSYESGTLEMGDNL